MGRTQGKGGKPHTNKPRTRKHKRFLGRDQGISNSKIKLDKAARDYARMLLNPCEGPVALPLLPGGTGNMIKLVKRYSWSEIKDGYTGSEPGHFIIGFDPWRSHVRHKVTSTGDIGQIATGGSTASNGVNESPFTFLQTETLAYRPVAGCMRYNCYSASNSIGGKLASINEASHTQLDCIATPTDTVSWNDLVNNASFIRTPLRAEMLFRPTTTSRWTSKDTYNANAGHAEETDNNMIFAGVNLGDTVDFEFIIEMVYEFKPRGATGIVHGHVSASSRNSVEDVVAYMEGAFSSIATNPFAIHAAKSLLGVALSYAYKRATTPYQNGSRIEY